MEITKLNQASFEEQVLQAGHTALVDFTAVWCQPCKMLEPVVLQLAEMWAQKVTVFKLDVDEHREVAMKYQVMGVPTLILFVNGKPVERVSGFQSKEKLLKKFAPHIGA